MSLAVPDRDALFSSPFGSSHSRTQPMAISGDAAFPRCSIQLVHNHAPFVLTYYCAPPHLSPSHPLFSHLLSSFLSTVQSVLGVVPVAFEGTDGLLYPPTVMLQLPSIMLEGKAFTVVAEQQEEQSLAAAAAGRAAQSGRAAALDEEEDSAEAWDRRARYKQKKSVSFGNGITERPAAAASAAVLSSLSSPSASSAAAVHAPSSFTAAHLHNKHPVPITTQFASSRLSIGSPQAPSPVPAQSPVLSPLPSSLLAPSAFPLPTYTTSIPLLRSLLSSAFFPVSLSSLPALFMAHSVQPAGSAQRLLPRSAFLPLMSALRNTAAVSSSSSSSAQRQSAVLSCFLSHFFSYLDADEDDGVDQATFIAGVALLLPLVPDAGGEEIDQLTVAFRLLDRGGKGWVTPAALFAAACKFIPALLSLSHPLSASASTPSPPPGIAFRSAFDVPSLLAAVYEIAGKMVREAFGCGDTDIDGRLSEDEFRALHLSRASCLPWVNVLVDPERAALREAAAGGAGGGAADVSISGAGGGGAAAGSGARGGQRRGEHGRSASVPVRVELTERRRGRDWDDKGSEPQQQTNGGRDEEEEEDEDDDDDDDEDDEEDEEEDEAVQEEAPDASGTAAAEASTSSSATSSSSSSPSLRHASELEEAIDAVMQLKMLQLTSSLSGSGNKRRGRSAEAANREAETWSRAAVLGGRSASEPHDSERKAAVAASGLEDDDDDAERTEAFLDQMWREMRRLNAGQQAAARRRTKRWSNDNSGQGEEQQQADADGDGQLAAEEEEMLAVQQRASASSHAPYSLPLSATVTAPRLSSLCTSSSFLSIHPHIAPFSSLQLESLLELFHLLTAHSASLQRADVPRLVANMAVGQSASSQQSMLDTMRCLFTCSRHTALSTHRLTAAAAAGTDPPLVSSPLPLCCSGFDTDEDDRVHSLDLMLALSAICARDSREQLNVGFALCDLDADGRLTVAEVERYLVDVMGAFFCLTEQWNTLVRLTRNEQAERAAKKKQQQAAQAAAAAAQQQKRSAAGDAATGDTAGSADVSHSPTSSSPSQADSSSPASAGSADAAAVAPSSSPSAAASSSAVSASQSASDSGRPSSPSFSLSTLRREVASLLINAATTAASHCFTVYTAPPMQANTSIDVASLWDWMDGVRREGREKEREGMADAAAQGAAPADDDSYPMFDVVKALYALL